jgi:hypothetical protein
MSTYGQWQAQALAPIEHELNKGYLVAMGLAKEVTFPNLSGSGEPSEIDVAYVSAQVRSAYPNEKLLVVKSHGWGGRMVGFVGMESDFKVVFGKKPQGVDTWRRLALRAQESVGALLVQPLIAPPSIELPDEKRHFMLYRPFFLYFPSTNSWEYVGGAWITSPGLKIHGTPDSVQGPLM